MHMLVAQFSEDGLHREHSPIYHLKDKLRLFSKPARLGDVEKFNEIAKKSLEAACWFSLTKLLSFRRFTSRRRNEEGDFPVTTVTLHPSFWTKIFPKSGCAYRRNQIVKVNLVSICDIRIPFHTTQTCR